MAILQYILPSLAVVSTTVYIVYKLFPWLKYDIQEVRVLGHIFSWMRKYQRQGKLLIDVFQDNADRLPHKTCVIFQDNNYSYEYIEKQMNKMAHAALEIGVKKGEVVAVLMANEPAFIWTAYGLSKIGAEPAYLNFNLRSKSLLHCFTISGAKVLIVGQNDDLIEAVREIYSDLAAQGVTVYVSGVGGGPVPQGFLSLDDIFEKASDSRPSKNLRSGIGFRSVMCYIYTSGTTGLPKAAIVSQDKMFKGSLLMTSLNVSGDDVFYTPLPLYHSAAGIVALGTTMRTGGTLVLRSKFSASHFIEDCRKHKVTVIQYIGELCRYLCARPKSPEDSNHCIRVAFGNGLRRDIWREFRDRFNIPFIGEFYAATEGNAGFINHYNKFGAIGRTSPLLRMIMPADLIKYDIVADEPIRNSKGFCALVGHNEPGLMIAQIKKDFDFDGYKGNKDLSKKKIIENVFKKGDKYFNTGDLLEHDEDYFLYFNDRIGDTFRWKGENVSTVEVSNVITDLSWVEDANVYGVEVPGMDGKAGMVSLSLIEGHEFATSDLTSFYAQCSGLLPQYAWPRFIRIQKEHDMTATFKLRKVELVKDGFDPSKVKDEPLFYLDSSKKAYMTLTSETFKDLLDGKIRV